VLFFLAPGMARADASNAELQRMFEQDQAERSVAAIDWTALTRRDTHRRERAQALLAAGALRTAADYYHAAMLFQHGDDLADFRLAHALATLAMAMAPEDPHYRWLVGASWDRLLMRQLQPQWYGTQFKSDAQGMYLYPVAEDAVTDTERKRLVGHTLAESRAHVTDAAREMGVSVRAKPPTIEELRQQAAASEVP
jgi:hypothetical protein